MSRSSRQTNIKAGTVTPLAWYFKGVLKLTLAVFLASCLNYVPMACIAGILFWVTRPAFVERMW